MTLKAILLGAIGAVAETSDIQRRAYNQALAEAGIDWQWDPDTYRKLLTEAGGKRRLGRLSSAAGNLLSDEQIDTIHLRKTEIACAEVAEGIDLRPGITTLVQQALDAGILVAFVTSTYRPNIDAIATGAGSALPLERFAAVLTTEDCERSKPAPDVYLAALRRLDVDASEAIAIEDSTASVSAAKAAGLFTIATPGQFTAGQDFSAADRVIQSLEGVSIAELQILLENNRRVPSASS
ncbi:MAG: HAD-IA family hydrolase [Pseudomonadota bacterium]